MELVSVFADLRRALRCCTVGLRRCLGRVLVVGAVTTALSAGTFAEESLNRVLVVVNDGVISEADLNREISLAEMELRSAGLDDETIQVYANRFQQNSQESARKALKEHFIFERIAEDEGIEATDSDYDDEIRSIALQSDESPRRVRARMEKRGQMDTLANLIVERKVIELICSKAKFSEVELESSIVDTTAMDHAVVHRDESDIPVAKHGGDAQELQQPADRS